METSTMHLPRRSNLTRSTGKLHAMDSSGGTLPASQEWSKSSMFMGETSPAWTRDMASFERSQSRIVMEDDALPKHKSNYWTPDRGVGFYRNERERKKRPSLVETGRKAGKSRVQYANKSVILIHSWMHDFFISAINTKLWQLMLMIFVIYLVTFLIFSGVWWGVQLVDATCISGEPSYVSSFIFSVVTQQTIGYGNTYPTCWGGAWVMLVQSMLGMLMDAVTIGVIFARISHPKYRGRTIGISDSAVIARRDGILKFMFRISDFRRTQVVEPKVRAYLYTWGGGRVTAEGEFIPVRSEELDIGYIDGMLLLPLIIEHTIDERSPLIGHTHDSLSAVNAEIVVTFEGTTEFGNPFMARQSYLPTEIHWGHRFVGMIKSPHNGQSRYNVDISKLHDVEPLEGLGMMPPSELSRLVVSKALRTVPYPLLGENTFVLSDTAILAPDENGNLALMVRIGDTYPCQHLEVVVRAYLYRWNPKRRPGSSGMPNDFDCQPVDMGYDDGRERLLLWLPVICKHVITPESPLSAWRSPEGIMADADATIVVWTEGYMYSNAQNRMRMRIYNVLSDVKRGHGFLPIVTPPAKATDLKPHVDWNRFHHTLPLEEIAAGAPDRSLETVPSEPLSAQDMAAMLRRDSANLEALGVGPPEARHFLNPDTDPLSTFRRRQSSLRPQLSTIRAAFSEPGANGEDANQEGANGEIDPENPPH